jgi:hypothetical protein
MKRQGGRRRRKISTFGELRRETKKTFELSKKKTTKKKERKSREVRKEVFPPLKPTPPSFPLRLPLYKCMLHI